MQSFDCTESNVPPVLDIVWGSLTLVGIMGGDRQSAGKTIAGALLSTGLLGSSAAYGFHKSSACRQARLQLSAGVGQGQGVPEAPVLALPAAVTVTVRPAADTLVVGAQAPFIAAAHTSSGVVAPDLTFAWSSSNDAIASVTNTGLVTAHAVGAAVITAIASNVVGAAQVIVLPQGEFHGG